MLDPSDRAAFHRLDDLFHYEIAPAPSSASSGNWWQRTRGTWTGCGCCRCPSPRGVPGSPGWILEALKARDLVQAEATRDHLGRIATMIDRIRDENRDWFAEL
ncbi:MAG: hypothetical protein R3D59_07125 [Paracoccaceae bacterium]